MSSLCVLACAQQPAGTREEVLLSAYESIVVLPPASRSLSLHANITFLASPPSDASSVSSSLISVSSPILPIDTSSSHLFFSRVRAVFAHSRTIQALFSRLRLVIAVSPASRYPISPLSLLPNGAVFLNDTLVCVFISKRAYGNAIFTSRGAAFWERLKQLCNSAGLFRILMVLLRIGLLYYRLPIGFQITYTTHVVLGLPYAEFVGMIYVGLFSALACRVFRMVLLCETDDDGGMGWSH
ncbi:hypothetical protein FIBSPDRAFT_943741 [Athelia psychrophila]|uniref:Uncharacterized protein n=1 Tax=Athelia psychrophila TaxID=1759441 RepID=A0A166VHN8_9AGAM|nr:hypothetical protein FIBSPDRAFT_943741 [Fibularhizoctonia sp. CBS 109695]